MRGPVLSSLHPGNVKTSSRQFATPLTRRRAGSAYRGSERSRTLTPPKYTNPESCLPLLFSTLPHQLSPNCLLPDIPSSRRRGTAWSTPGAGLNSAEKPVRSAGVETSGCSPGGGRRWPSLPTASRGLPETRHSLSARNGGAGSSGRFAAGCSVGLGARRVAGAAGPVRGARRKERLWVGCGARSLEQFRAAELWWEPASGSACAAASPVAPPAAPLTFQLQEKLPSGRFPRLWEPRMGSRWLAGRGRGRPSPRLAASEA